MLCSVKARQAFGHQMSYLIVTLLLILDLLHLLLTLLSAQHMLCYLLTSFAGHAGSSPGKEGHGQHQAEGGMPAVGNSQTQHPTAFIPPHLPGSHHSGLQAAALSPVDGLRKPAPADAVAGQQMLRDPQQHRVGKAQPKICQAQPHEHSEVKLTELERANSAVRSQRTRAQAAPAQSDTKGGATTAGTQKRPAAAKPAASDPNRGPGKCSQGALADANEVHGVAAVVVRARRSKSCSGSTAMCQHAAKKLTFQQLTLAKQPRSRAADQGRTAQSLDAAQVDSSRHRAHTRQSKPIAAAEPDASGPLQVGHQSLEHVSAADADTAAATAVLAQLVAATASQRSQQPPASVQWPLEQQPLAQPPLLQSHLAQQAEPHDQCMPEAGAQQDAPAHHQLQGQQQTATCEQAEGGSQQQWEAAISQLHSLAEKHSPDSQSNDAGAGASTDAQACAGASVDAIAHRHGQPAAVGTHDANEYAKLQTAQTEVAASVDGMHKGQSSVSNIALPSDAATSNAAAGCDLQQAVVPVPTALPSTAPPGRAGQPGVSQTAGQALAMPGRTQARQAGYTGLSRLRQVMRQQQQPQGQDAHRGQDQEAQLHPRQVSGQNWMRDQAQGEGQLQGQGQKRKCPEREVALGHKHVAALNASGSCKRQRLQAPASAGSRPQPPEQQKIVQVSPATGPRAPVAVISAASHQAGACKVVQPAKADAAAAVCGDSHPGCEHQQGSGTTLADLPSETVAAAEAATAAAWARASDRGGAGQEGSQGQQGGLRLDLSSEEDPLLCTQRMPSSQSKMPCTASAAFAMTESSVLCLCGKENA